MKIIRQTKTLVKRVDQEGNEYMEVGVENWSNLIEAAVYNNMFEVVALMAEAKSNEIDSSLRDLQFAIDISKKYKNGDLRSLGNMDRLEYHERIFIEPALRTERLLEGRANLLVSLTDRQLRKMDLSETDKRLIEKKLIQQVRECKSIVKIDELFIRHDYLLNHKRQTSFSYFNRSGYSTLAKNFIAEAQAMALSFGDRPFLPQEISTLRSRIFAEKHIQKGYYTSHHHLFERRFLELEEQQNGEEKNSLLMKRIEV